MSVIANCFDFLHIRKTFQQKIILDLPNDQDTFLILKY